MVESRSSVPRPVAITGVAALTAYGRGAAALVDGALTGTAAFAPVSRFDVSRRRVKVGALLPGTPDLTDELIWATTTACEQAGLTRSQRAAAPLLLAAHGDPALARAVPGERANHSTGAFAERIAAAGDVGGGTRAYTSACVAASTAVADAAAMVAAGDLEHAVVAAGYLVEPDQFAVFDAGRALASDGAVRPFSAGRTGLLLGDGVAAVVIEAAEVAAGRGAPALARVAGWGRSGDGYHVCQPRPDGSGLARAIGSALRRAGIDAAELGYVNAHGSGSPQSDAAEANALRLALGPDADRVPVSSTKSLHGQALEASALVELVLTVLALARGQLPPNAGFLGVDQDCPLNLVLGGPRPATPRWALSVNAAFGGANTALVLETAQ